MEQVIDADEHTDEGRSFGALLSSTEGVYGLIVVAGMIVVSRNLVGNGTESFRAVALTLLVFFAVHVYAATVAEMSAGVQGDGGIFAAFRIGMRESLALLVLGAIPLGVLFLGVIGVLRQADSVWLALGVDMLLLGILGWFIAAARHPGLWARLGGALVTALFGALMIALKALIHH